MEAVKAGAAGRHRIEVRGVDIRTEAAQMGEAGVVEHDGQYVGRARRRLRIVGKTGGRLGGGEADPLRWFRRGHGVTPASGWVVMATG